MWNELVNGFSHNEEEIRRRWPTLLQEEEG